MPPSEPLVAILAAATLFLMVLAVLLAAALRGRGPLYGRLLEINVGEPRGKHDPEGEPEEGYSARPSVRLLARNRQRLARTDMVARRGPRPPDDGLDRVLRGSFAVDTYNRAVRVLAWSSVLVVLLIVSVSQLWRPVEPQIFTTLIVAGAFILLVHELMPPGSIGSVRVVLEGSAGIVFLTMLVLLTGNASSPFFFLYALLLGGVSMIAAPGVTIFLTLGTVAAYALAALAPMDATITRDTLARVGVNLAALVLLAYSGMTIARVQRRTRDSAIRLSTVDSLTELFNRAYLFKAVDREIDRGRRFKRGFCLLMMDLDGLKAINDRFGHYQGDIVLRGMAQVIKSSLRNIDVAARYGGDEFVALLPETDPSGAFVVAEKIRLVASELVLETDGQQISTSLSIGVVSYPEDGHTADELMIAADEAMYSSKRLGKNRVVGYAEPSELGQPLEELGVSTTPGWRALPSDDVGWTIDRGRRR
jgi:diguanylate cyclase (GGDEF)-like protein